MDRRTALKQSAVIAGGLAFLPACNFGPDRELVALDNLEIDLEHQDLLARIIDTIIPSAQDNPGAEVLDLYRFVLIIVDDCEKPEQQQLFTEGLKAFKGFVKQHLGQTYPLKEQKSNEEILIQLAALDATQSRENLQQVQSFLKIARKYVIRGFLGSEHVMTQVFPYKLVPGPYQDCVSTDGLIVM